MSNRVAAKPFAPKSAAPKPTPPKPTAAKRGGRKAKPSCSTCYFGKRMLCALDLDGPCSTYRPDTPYGLIPPTQPMLLIEADGAALASERPAA